MVKDKALSNAARLVVAGMAAFLLGRNSKWLISDYDTYQHVSRASEGIGILLFACALNLFCPKGSTRWYSYVFQYFIAQSVANVFCRTFAMRERFNPFEYLVAIGLVIFYRMAFIRETKQRTND